MKKNYTVQVLIEQDEDGRYVSSCPSLEGCSTQGDTFEEAMENIRDVIMMCMKELAEEKKTFDLKYPEIIGVKHLEIAI
ncbi:MAG: type II toxin-antitoxin system HicB family antitoxin [Candidatus Eremiobacteraeota bacterium]|nr:type II toxin-antitoxin system HicB family antitoxin [Candidatus Eremiobacteraeota bacterium]